MLDGADKSSTLLLLYIFIMVSLFLQSEGDKPENEENLKFCRVILPDGSTTVVYAKQGQTIRHVLSALCEKRNMSVAAIDVFLLGSDRVRFVSINV